MWTTMRKMRKEQWSDCLTSKDIRGTLICDTTVGGKLRDCHELSFELILKGNMVHTMCNGSQTRPF